MCETRGTVLFCLRNKLSKKVERYKDQKMARKMRQKSTVPFVSNEKEKEKV
jgi:hypothetical protein